MHAGLCLKLNSAWIFNGICIEAVSGNGISLVVCCWKTNLATHWVTRFTFGTTKAQLTSSESEFLNPELKVAFYPGISKDFILKLSNLWKTLFLIILKHTEHVDYALVFTEVIRFWFSTLQFIHDQLSFLHLFTAGDLSASHALEWFL